MKYICISLLFVLSLLPLPLNAAEKGEQDFNAIQGMLLYCLPAVVKGEKSANLAEQGKLQELPAEKAKKFAAEGRVFVIPKQEGNAVLIARDNGVCSVAIRKVEDYDVFWAIVEKWFGPETPFTLKEETSIDGGQYKSFVADFSGNVAMMISARKNATEGQMQALLTSARFQD